MNTTTPPPARRTRTGRPFPHLRGLVAMMFGAAAVLAACSSSAGAPAVAGTSIDTSSPAPAASMAAAETAAPVAAAPADAEAAAEVLTDSQAFDGEYADEAWVTAAIDALYARDAFTFEVRSTAEASEGPVTTRVYGIVRPSDEAFVVNWETEGSVSQYVAIGEESWIDYGDGEYRPQEERDDSGDHLRTLWDEYFASYADDFVVAGHETTHGRKTVHLTVDPHVVETKVEMFGEEYRPWTLDLWLAEDDGHLVRAVYGGPQAPISFTVPEFTIDVESVDCACPVHDPS